VNVRRLIMHASLRSCVVVQADAMGGWYTPVMSRRERSN
jgi:hypothetical protein